MADKKYSIKEIKEKAKRAGCIVRKTHDGEIIVRYTYSFKRGVKGFNKDFKALTKNLRVMRNLLAPHGYVYKSQVVGYGQYPQKVKVKGVFVKNGKL